MVVRLSVLMFLQWGVPGSLVPLYSYHLEKLGFGPLTVAVGCATQAAASIVSSLLTGQLADRWLPAERAMTLFAAAAGIDLWLLADLHHPAAVLAATLLFWLLSGPMILLGTTIGFTHLPAPDRQYGPVRLWGTVGWMVVGWLGSWWLGAPACLAPLRELLHHDGPPPLTDTFRLGAVVAFVVAAYSCTLPHTPPRRDATTHRPAPVQAIALLWRPSFAVYCLCLLGACITFPFSTQSTPLLLTHLGVPPERLSLVLTLAQTTEVAALALLPVLLHRFGLRGTMLFGLTAWLAANAILSLGRPVELVVSSLTLNGFYVTCFMIAGQVYVNGQARTGVRASAQALITCLGGVGMLGGNLLAGGLRRLSGGELPPTFAVAAGLTAVLLLTFLLGFREEAARPE